MAATNTADRPPTVALSVALRCAIGNTPLDVVASLKSPAFRFGRRPYLARSSDGIAQDRKWCAVAAGPSDAMPGPRSWVGTGLSRSPSMQPRSKTPARYHPDHARRRRPHHEMATDVDRRGSEPRRGP